MPSLSNIIVRSGIGPLTLADTSYHNYSIAELPKEFWILITGVSLSGAILLLTFISLSVIRIVNKIRLKTLDSLETSATFLILGGMIYLFPILISGFIFFDRYLLPVIPLFLVAIVYIHANFRQTPGRFKHYLIPILLLILSAIFSIAPVTVSAISASYSDPCNDPA